MCCTRSRSIGAIFLSADDNSIFCLFLCYGFDSFPLHIIFLILFPCFSLQFLFLMTEAILTFSSDNFLTRNLTHSDRVSLHWKLQLGAATCILTGFLCIFSNKMSYGREHFTSWHGSFGLWTLLLTAGTICGGVIAKYGYHWRHVIAPVILKSMHAAFGIGTYILALFTLCLGLYSEWLRGHMSDTVIYVFIVGVFLVEFYVLIKPTLTVVSQVKK